MFGFLPERVYRAVKDDLEFREWEAVINEKMASNDLVKRIVKEDTFIRCGGKDFLAKRNAVFEKILSPNLQRNAKIIETDDEATLLELLKTETDLENKLFIYETLVGIVYYLSNKPDVMGYITEYINIVDENSSTFSEKIHEEYFTYKCFLIKNELFNDPKLKLEAGIFQDYCNQIDFIIDDICEIFDNTDYIVNLMRHCKVFQMFDFFATMLDYFGPQMELSTIIEKEVLPNLNANKFKYSQFNYYKIQLLDAIAKFFFDLRSEKFFEILKVIVDTINSSFEPENRPTTVKALNFYNDSLTIGYLNFIKKYRHIVEVKIPEFPYKINLENMSVDEQGLTDDFRSPTDILKSKYNVTPYMSADKICNLYSRQIRAIKEYIDFNTPHFESFRNMAKLKYGQKE